MKEKLIELLRQAQSHWCDYTDWGTGVSGTWEEFYADYLLENGVIVKDEVTGERKMTVDEKRAALDEFCGRINDDCKSCPLYNSWHKYKWKEPMPCFKCPTFRNSPESDLDKAMEICGIANTVQGE